MRDDLNVFLLISNLLHGPFPGLLNPNSKNQEVETKNRKEIVHGLMGWLMQAGEFKLQDVYWRPTVR